MQHMCFISEFTPTDAPFYIRFSDMNTILKEADPDLLSMQIQMLNNLTPHARVLLTAMVVADGANEPAYHTIRDMHSFDAGYRQETKLTKQSLDETRSVVPELEWTGLVRVLQDKSRKTSPNSSVSLA